MLDDAAAKVDVVGERGTGALRRMLFGREMLSIMA